MAKKTRTCVNRSGKTKRTTKARCPKGFKTKKPKARKSKSKIAYSTGSSYNEGYAAWKRSQEPGMYANTYGSSAEAWIAAQKKKGKKGKLAMMNGARRRRRRSRR